MADNEVFEGLPDSSPQDVFKAISDPSRRKILKILQRGSRSAGELSEAFDFTKGSLSHHFNILKAANLVRSERRGQQIVYMLNMSVLEETMAMLLDLFGGKVEQLKVSPSPRPAGRSLRETWPAATAGAEVRRGETPRDSPAEGEGVPEAPLRGATESGNGGES